MDYKLSVTDHDNCLLNSPEFIYHIDSAGTKIISHYLELDGSTSHVKEVVFPFFKIRYGNSCLLETINIDFEFMGESLEMNFLMQGATRMSLSQVGETYNRCSNTHNLFYCKNLEGHFTWLTKECSFFEVNLVPELFMNYLPTGYDFDFFKKEIKKKQIALLARRALPITPKMTAAITQIINCPYKDHFQKLYIETRVLELLLLQLEQVKIVTSDTTRDLTPYVVEQMHYAKEIIEENRCDPLTLSQLSLALGTNECSLKKNFKSTFGTTVFGYLKQLKMEEAKQLLLDTQMTIGEVSETMGYKNQQHFTAAFKKYHGCLPSQIMKS